MSTDASVATDRRKPSTCMRINFATTQNLAFWRCFARVRDQLGASTPSTPRSEKK